MRSSATSTTTASSTCFVAKGNVEGMVDFARRDPNNLLLGQADRSFREAAIEAGIVTFERARGAALADLNLDGLLDLVVVNREAPAELVAQPRRPRHGRSRSPADGRLDPAPAGAAGPPTATGVGAWVEVRSGAHVWRREVTVGGGHASGQAGWIHVGVGTAERIEVRVQWPDGQWGPWVRAFANQFLLIRRNDERPLYWYPAEAAG